LYSCSLRTISERAAQRELRYIMGSHFFRSSLIRSLQNRMGVIAGPPPVTAAPFPTRSAAQGHSDSPARPQRRPPRLAHHVRGVRPYRSRSYRLGGGRETVRPGDGRNVAQRIGANIIAPTRRAITAVSRRDQPGNGVSWEECFYGVGVRVRMAEISAVLVAAPLSLLALLFFSCLSVCLCHSV
jgi:hypothetical protein